jgi:hypothetical protein
MQSGLKSLKTKKTMET